MESLRLAAIVKTSPATGTRRTALRRVLGGAAVVTIGALGSATRSGAKKPRRKCKPKQCKGNALGAACQTVRDCCGTETNMGCLTAKYSPETLVCCGMNGFACSSGGDCCDGFSCSSATHTCV